MKQTKNWAGKFGSAYTDRNPQSIEEMDKLYLNNYGITRTKLNKSFLDKLDRNIKILEVGSNVGIQMVFLQKMGFKNLYGIEINEYAVELSKQKTKNINIIRGSVFDIPFKNNYFDLVFTSGLLIHISPENISIAIKEIHRCAKKLIWGFEYYADKYIEINYHGEKNLLWKTNFSKLFTDSFHDLKLVKEKKLKYLASENIDAMFLLRKTGN